jgi:uncharacterized membrane protein
MSGSGWSATEALGFAWNAIMKNFAGVSLPIFVALLIVGVPTYIVTMVFGAMTTVMAEHIEPTFLPILSVGVQGVVGVAALVVGSYMAGGITELALRTARGETTSFGIVFSGGKYFGSMLVGTLGFYIAYAIGLALCIVPGVIVALGLMPFWFVIVDEKLSGIDALKRAWALTSGHKMSIFVFFLLVILVYIAGILACFIGAYLVSIPMLVVAQAYIYLRLKGEQPRLPA